MEQLKKKAQEDPCPCNMQICTLTSRISRMELLLDEVLEHLKMKELVQIQACAEREKALSPGSALVSIDVPDVFTQPEMQSPASIHEAAKLKNTSALVHLLARGADPHEVDTAGNTALHCAASSGDALAVELLLACGSALEAKNHDGFTPFLMAAWFGRFEVAKILLEEGALIDEPNLTGHTPLMCAIILQNAEMVSFLEERGASLDVKDANGDKPIIIAAKSSLTYSLKILIESPRISVDDVMKALEVAAGPEAFRILKNAVSTSKICSTKFSLLPRLAELGWEKSIELLLYDCRKCEDADHMRNLQKALCLAASSPVMLRLWKSKPVRLRRIAMNRAAVMGWLKALDVILPHWKADIGLEGHSDEIEEAMRGAKDPKAMLRLIGAQGCLAKSSAAHRVFWASAERGWGDVLDELIAKGVPVDVSLQNGATALHCAAEKGQSSCVELLLERGACPNAVNQEGWTPLHVASNCRNKNVMEILINGGADPNVKDPSGCTAFDVGIDLRLPQEEKQT